MGKLTNLRSPLGVVGARLRPLDDMRKVERRDWRPWYGTARWRELRKAVLLRDLYTCQWPGCGRVGGRLVVDHRRPHRGDERLFWDDRNLQTLCKSPCHDKHKQALEVSGRFG